MGLNLVIIHSNKRIDDFSGNKIDREDREIPTEVGEEFSQRHGMYFLETSAKASDNVERLFTEIAQDLLQQARSRDLPSYNSPSVQQILDPSGTNFGAGSGSIK